MDNLLFWLATALAAVLIAAKLIYFFMDFTADTRYLRMEVKRADCREEYLYWRRELHCRYLTLIPFITIDKAHRIYRFLFRKKQWDKKGYKDDR